MRTPWLVLAFISELVALAVVTAIAGAEAASSLELDTIAVALGGALAGAALPVGRGAQG